MRSCQEERKYSHPSQHSRRPKLGPESQCNLSQGCTQAPPQTADCIRSIRRQSMRGVESAPSSSSSPTPIPLQPAQLSLCSKFLEREKSGGDQESKEQAAAD